VNCPTPWKISFGSRREALTTTRGVSRRGKADAKQLRPYHCRCGGWHLTSMSSAQLRQLRKQRRMAVAA